MRGAWIFAAAGLLGLCGFTFALLLPPDTWLLDEPPPSDSLVLREKGGDDIHIDPESAEHLQLNYDDTNDFGCNIGFPENYERYGLGRGAECRPWWEMMTARCLQETGHLARACQDTQAVCWALDPCSGRVYPPYVLLKDDED